MTLGQRLLSRAQSVALAQRQLGAVNSRLRTALPARQSLGVPQRRMCAAVLMDFGAISPARKDSSAAAASTSGECKLAGADSDAVSGAPSEELLAKLRVLPQDQREALANQMLEELDVGDTTVEITEAQLKKLYIATAVPMVGFGFMDNAVMIICGEFIEIQLGATLCISTLMAAAIGNLFSDLVGLGTGGIIEAGAARYGVEVPMLTSKQLAQRSAVLTRHAGSVCGLTLGCLIGLFPLIFHDEEVMRLKKVFTRYDTDGNGSLDWEEIRLAFADAKMYPSEQDMHHLFDKYDLNKDGLIVFEEFRVMIEDLQKALKVNNALDARGFMAAEAHLLDMEHEEEIAASKCGQPA